MASTLMSNADVRAHVQSGLSDAAFERLIDACDADIVRAAGAHEGSVTEFFDAKRVQTIFLSRTPMASPAPVVSITYLGSGAVDQVIPTTEYRIEGKRLINEWTWDYYGGYHDQRVKVVYTPVADLERRRRALVEMVRVTALDSGLKASGIDGITKTYMDTQAARQKVLRELVGLSRPMMGMA